LLIFQLGWLRLCGCRSVGWVERSETHHIPYFSCKEMGFATLNPSYEATRTG